jgi:BASS family bile acid:Na+ symporter
MMPQLALPLGLAFLMVVVGLRLDAGQLWWTLRQPTALLAGLTAQMLVLPLLALTIARGLALPPDLALGLLIIAISPGGITSNYVALLTGADVALSTAMTLITTLAASFTIPLVLGLQGVSSGPTGLLHIALAMTAASAGPLLIGMGFKRLLPVLAQRLESSLGKAAKLVFAGVVLATFWQNRETLLAHLPAIGLACILLNLGAMAAGFAGRLLPGVTAQQSLAMAIECGLQNAAVAMFLCGSVLHRAELQAPALVYAVVMNVSVLGLVFYGQGGARGRKITPGLGEELPAGEVPAGS